MYRYRAKKSPLRSALSRLLCTSLVLSSFPASAQAARIGSQAVIPVAPKGIGVPLGGSIPLLQGPNMVGGVAQLRSLTTLPLSVKSVSAQALLGFIIGPALIPVAAPQETSVKLLDLPVSPIPMLSGLERAVESKFSGERLFDSVGRPFSAASSGVVPPVHDQNPARGRSKSKIFRKLIKDHPEVLKWLGPVAQAHPEVLDWLGPVAQAHPEVLKFIGPVAMSHPEVLEWIGPVAQAHPEVLRFKIPYAWTAKEPVGQKKIWVLFRHWIGPAGIFVAGAGCLASIYFGMYPLVLVFALIGVMCEVFIKFLYMRKT